MTPKQNMEEELRKLPIGAQIRVERDEFDSGRHVGYLAGIGAEFFALQVVNDGIHLDGFAALRLADVTSLESPDSYAGDFIDRALELRGERLAPSCPLDLSTPEALVRSARSAYGLVTVHVVEEPGVCFIGECQSMEDGVLTMKSITPAAEWDDELETLHLADICEVNVGDAYAEALARVNESPA